MNLKEIFKQSIIVLEKAGIETAGLDAQVLICQILKKDKVFILTHPEYKLRLTELIKIKRNIKRRSKNEPVAYITGHKEFFGYNFLVNRNVLIPRPESEELVILALKDIEDRLSIIGRKNTSFDNRHSIIDILDLGTGTGCLIISLANELKKKFEVSTKMFFLHASEISRKSLNMAKKNAEKHGIKKEINFHQSDLFENQKIPEKLDLIIANLPYVPINQGKNLKAKRDAIDFEPKPAIFANNNGTAVIKKFLKEAKSKVNKNGLILIELDPRNAIELKDYAHLVFEKAKIELIQDLAGLNRYLKIRL
jgi:release factor glutamine methyltransferase